MNTMNRILIVEDDPAMSVALRDGFEFEKYAVEMAADGEEGLRLASRGVRSSGMPAFVA